MAYAHFPSNDGSEFHESVQSARFRLRDAEKIAADRLETGGDGTLKEALASVDPSYTPPNEIERLTDRIEAAQAGYNAAAIETSTLPFPAEPLPDPAAGEAPNLTLLGLPEWSEAQAAVAAELAETQSLPLVLQEEQTTGTHWRPAGRDADPYSHPLDAPLDHPAVSPADARPAQAVAVMPEPAAVEPPTPEPPAGPVSAPISTALDTAAKLTADANAAAVALENLTRLLHNHQRPAAVIPSAQHLSQRPPQLPPRPTPPAPYQRPAAPAPAVTEQRPATRAVMPPTLRPTAAPESRQLESRQFDVRGFMAGFALSWAIGAVLYIYLMVS
jgi:hypothetical protein